MSDIWTRRHELENLRMLKQRELMDAWMRESYYPERSKIISDCAKIGHKRGKFHSNGVGWTWFYCNHCGGRMEITGPDGGKSFADDGA